MPYPGCCISSSFRPADILWQWLVWTQVARLHLALFPPPPRPTLLAPSCRVTSQWVSSCLLSGRLIVFDRTEEGVDRVPPWPTKADINQLEVIQAAVCNTSHAHTHTHRFRSPSHPIGAHGCLLRIPHMHIHGSWSIYKSKVIFFLSVVPTLYIILYSNNNNISDCSNMNT